VQKFPVIIGPTAGGKSDLAVNVALRLAGAEIVTADSVQIYRGMDIGSAKPTAAEQRGVRHHLIDIVDPRETFTVSDWLDAAERTAAEIKTRGGVPIIVGGTHLYIKAFLEGLFEGPPPDAGLRERLRARGLAALRQDLERVDPAAAMRIHPNDERRTIRALEVYHQTGIPITEHQQQWDRGGVRRDCVLVGLDWPVEALNRRINARVRQMVERGLLEEVRRLWSAGALGPQAREALGYKQLIRHLEGGCTLEDAVEEIKIETRRLAKNQRTWIRRLRTTPESAWIDAESVPPDTRAERVLRAVGGEIP
jgi:tRNA dimethylallyltransferase